MSIASANTNIYLSPPGDIFTSLVNALAEIRAVIRHDPVAADRYIDRFELLLQQARPVDRPAEGAGVSGGLAPWQVTRVKRHVEANLNSRLSMADLATLVRLSENHFARAFKTSVGCPPHAYIVSQRIARAKELIVDTDAPLSEIALACGLSDQAHLSRLFRRLVGTSPAMWRRRQRTLAGDDAELAELYLQAPEVTRRNTRIHFIQPLKERIVWEVGYGLLLEGASSTALVKSTRSKT